MKRISDLVRGIENTTIKVGRAVSFGFAAGKRELFPPKETAAKEVEAVKEAEVVSA